MSKFDEEINWDLVDTKGYTSYSKEERAKLEKMYEKTLVSIPEEEVTKGTIVGITDRDVIVNIGFKSDGLIPLSEFRDMGELKIGDDVEVFIEKREDVNGQLILSVKKAKLAKAWELIHQAMETDLVVEGMVKRRTKGGLIIDIYGVEAFLPGSQIDVKPIRDFDIYVNKKMEVKIIKINHLNDNVVVSHKVLIEKDIEQQKSVILNNLEKGQVLEGEVKNITNFGVFIDLGGLDGLMYITDISWNRVSHPDEVLQVGQKINVVVLDFDDDKKKISLGMKQLTPHPWDSLPADIQAGSKVKGKISNILEYGAFLEIMPGVEGLIHVAETSWSQHSKNSNDFFKVGDEIEAVVLSIDREERKMSLGIKQLSEDPWIRQDTLTKYAVGTRHTGIVRTTTPTFMYLELEEGIEGRVKISDLSWTKKVKHPNEFAKLGEKLEVIVLEIDVENKKLTLGHKQLEENPWNTFETIFTVGSTHACTILSENEKGAVVELSYGIEGFVPLRHLKKQDGKKAQIGEKIDCVVVEFSKEDRKIILSHTNTYSIEKEEVEEKKEKKVKKQTEKSTLGDIEALSSLKKKMSGDDQEDGEKKKTKSRKTKSKPDDGEDDE